MNITIDASVFVAAARTDEIHYAASRQFLQQAQTPGMRLFCPTLVLPECAAAIARPTGNATLAQELVALVENYPGLQLIPLEAHLAHQAVEVATNHRLRGADAAYVAVASMCKAMLLTWDGEMLERGSLIVPAMTPDQWMQER